MSEFPKRLKIEVLFDIGEIVYLVTDLEQNKYTVMGYCVDINTTTYELHSYSSGTYVAQAFEVSREKEVE